MTENNARPRLTLLTEEQKHQVHQNALHLLSATGVCVGLSRRIRPACLPPWAGQD